mgnify:FL=1
MEFFNSDAKYKQIFNLIPDAIFIQTIADGGGESRFLEVNDAACRLMECTREEIMALPTTQIRPEVSQSDIAKIVENLKQFGVHRCTDELYTRAGKKVRVERISSFHTVNGKQMVMTVFRNLAE